MNNPYFLNRLYLWSVLILLLQACHKPDNDAEPDNDTAEYVVKEVHANGKLQRSYEYNDAWQLVKSSAFERVSPRTGYNSYVSYFYNNSGQLERTETITDGPPPPSFTEYTYNNQGRLTTVKLFKKKDSSLLYQEEYDYNGQTITKTLSNNGLISAVYTYTVDNRGNIVRAETGNHSSGIYVEEWENFDDKINSASPGVGGVVSKNNPRRRMRYASGQKPVETLMSYTYKGAGYVTSCEFYDPVTKSTSTANYVLIPKQ
jgi:hypothetical protein